VQVGITVVGAAAAAFSAATFAAQIAPHLARLDSIGEDAEQVALAVIVVLISCLLLVLGELVPKSLGLRYSECYLLFAARPVSRPRRSRVRLCGSRELSDRRAERVQRQHELRGDEDRSPGDARMVEDAGECARSISTRWARGTF
jgi:CBS domain containing-hemolysin-like protein